MEQATVAREWFSYPEAERYSGLSRVTLWRAVSRGELKAARIGRSVRISRAELDRFMEQATAK
jgi:excisionase family DNA binding protein